MTVALPLYHRCQKGLIPFMFHSGKDEFHWPRPKHTEGEFFPVSINCGTHSCYPAAVTQERQLYKGGDGPLLPTIHWAPLAHPHPHLLLCTNSKTVFLLQAYLNLNSKELHSLWARGSQIHFLLQWPSGSLALSRPPPLESLHRFVPYKAVLLLLLSTEGKGEPSHLGLQHNASPWKESFERKTHVAPEIFQNPSCFPFWKIFSEISKSSLTVDQTLVIGPKGLFHCVPKIVYLD